MGGVPAEDRARVFAANRAAGRVAFSVRRHGVRSARSRVHESGSLRARFPNADPGELEVVFVNTAGGVAGGDTFGIDIGLGEGACLVAGTAAAEKVYRALGPAARVAIRLDVGAGASLAWLPQETILFDGARLDRAIDIALAPDATLLLAEAVVFGRTAMGEAVHSGAVSDRWRVRRGGRLVFAETLRLDDAISGRLRETAVAAGAVAVATVLIVPGGQTHVDAVRALEGLRGEVGASAWNGIAVVRFVARDGAALRHDLMAVLTVLRGRALPRLWLN